MTGYQIGGLGAPRQRFYYAGVGQPSGIRAPSQSNLAIAPRMNATRIPGLGAEDTTPETPGMNKLLLIAIGLFAFGVFAKEKRDKRGT